MPVEVEIEEQTHNGLALRWGERALLEHLRGMRSEAVHFVHTGDLAYSIHLNRSRWEGLARAGKMEDSCEQESAALRTPVGAA